MRYTGVIATMLVMFSAEAQIYKCVIDGKTTFSQFQCGESAKVVEIDNYAVETTATAEAVTSSLENNPLLLEYRAKRKTRLMAQEAAAKAYEAKRAQEKYIKKAVDDGRIVMGMGPEDVKDVLGDPHEVKTTKSSNGLSQQWYYWRNKRIAHYVTFRDGKVDYYSRN